MDEIHHGDAPQPGERIERKVVIEERSPSSGGPHRPARSSMWMWVLPLVIIVLLLMWYVFTRGEPRSPFAGDAAPGKEGERIAPATAWIPAAHQPGRES
jgi:hypothetical protein